MGSDELQIKACPINGPLRLKSSFEMSQMATKAKGIENKVGLSKGNGAVSLLKYEQTRPEGRQRMTPVIDAISPSPPPITMPLVVAPFQVKDIEKVGKLQDAEIE